MFAGDVIICRNSRTLDQHISKLHKLVEKVP